MSRRFVLSRADIRSRHLTVAGELAVAFAIAAAAHQVPGERAYAGAIAILGSIFVAFFATFALASHVRYLLHSRTHHLDVALDRLTFQTGKATSVLLLGDVGRTERHDRFREGPSLMLRLKNGRHVRLAGYEDQSGLMEVVEGHVGRVREG